MDTENLTRRQDQAIAALLTQPTLAKAAAECGVGERTLRRWTKEPLFAAAYQEARRQFLEMSLGRLQRASGRAVTRLIRLVDSPDARVATRAALGVIDRAVKAAELQDVLARLEALELAAKERNVFR
jgi:hypothetical protein